MTTTLGVVAVQELQVRVSAADARAALAKVSGLTAVQAVAKLRFGPGRTCEPVARLIDKALARTVVAAEQLVVAGGSAEPAEDIVRVRRKAHGKADWISSPTADLFVELRPAGLYQSTQMPADPPKKAAVAETILQPMTPAATNVREVLYDVLDPDLGVNIVDLGFVRNIVVDDHRIATITMTLTSAACPLTGIMEDQIRSVLRENSDVCDFVMDWQWVPSWRPADITQDGREQLRAVGFNGF
jgi:metal-sulfur cluster biosynthetic enzyme/ribosomal protein L22